MQGSRLRGADALADAGVAGLIAMPTCIPERSEGCGEVYRGGVGV